MEKTINIKFSELCDEIDFWKAEAIQWQEKYEELYKKHNKMVDDGIEAAHKSVGTILSIALASEEKSDGSIVINRDKIKQYS